MTDRELCVVSAVWSDYAGEGSGLDLQGGSIRLASAEERSCWWAGNRVSLTGTGGEIQAMAAGGSVTPRRGRKVKTMAFVRSLWMLAVESAPVGYVGTMFVTSSLASPMSLWIHFRTILSVGTVVQMVCAALLPALERNVAGSVPTIGEFHTVGPSKKAAFACWRPTLNDDNKKKTFTYTQSIKKSFKCTLYGRACS